MILDEITRLLLSVIGALLTSVVFLAWRTLVRIERKVEEAIVRHHECREELPKRFLEIPHFEKWQRGRDEIWTALNKHSHDDDGRVVR